MAPAKGLSGNLRKTAIIIAGSHRSGTSALTRVLSILGCDLPKTLLAPSGANETGFWESSLVNRLNDDILGEFGQRWFDVGDISCEPDPERLAPFRKRALALLHDEFGDGGLLLVKDPRICRLMPFWLDALSAFEAKRVAVLPIRNPLEIAASLQRRNGIEAAVSHFIWLRYILDAELGSRTIPRTFTAYDALVHDWRAVADRIASELGLAWPSLTPVAQADIGSFLSSSLRHHVEPPDSVMGDPGVPGWVRDAFGVVDQWARTGEEPAGRDILDRIRNDFGATYFQFDGLFSLAKSNRLKLKQLSKQAEADTVQIEALRSRLSKVTRDLTALWANATVDTAQLQALQEKLDKVSASAAHLDTLVRAKEAEVDSLRSQIADHVAVIAERDATIAGFEARLAQKERRNKARGAQVAKIVARAEDLAELKRLRVRLDERSRLIAEGSARMKPHDVTAKLPEAEKVRQEGAQAGARSELGEKADLMAAAEQRPERSFWRRVVGALAGRAGNRRR